MSSKRRERRRECKGKRSYDSLDEAIKMAGRTMADNGDGYPMQAYRCHFCSCFHVGHMPQRIRRAINARRKVPV